MPPGPTQDVGLRDRRLRIGELLVRGGAITESQLRDALREQSSWGGRLGENLLHDGLIGEDALATTVARQLGLELVDLERTPPDPEAARLVPLALAERYGLVGLAVVDGRILVACEDPTSNAAMTEVRRATRLLPYPCVATASQIDRAIRSVYYGEAEPVAAPDPRLDVRRAALVAGREEDGLDDLARRMDTLLDLLRREPGSR